MAEQHRNADPPRDQQNAQEDLVAPPVDGHPDQVRQKQADNDADGDDAGGEGGVMLIPGQRNPNEHHPRHTDADDGTDTETFQDFLELHRYAPCSRDDSRLYTLKFA